ncbi:MAG: nitrate reductase molybdenum cofactor assembly chaperone [Desulfocapsaceae bacterium]|nr:nitrate reductase molybdenum cofactor assembly chaperone [Desulfocapsaceae bacterium]
MTESELRVCKLLAFLLEYPDASWRDDLAELGGIVKAMTDDTQRDRLQEFLSYVQDKSSIELQEIYTRAFDLDPETSLHLSYHLMGNSEDRGKALAGLLWIYHRAGYDAAVGELPDYLPMILEFLTLSQELEGAEILWSCLGTVAVLAERLQKNNHPYAGLLALAADILHSPRRRFSEKLSKEG